MTGVTELVVAIAGLITAITGLLGMVVTWRKNSAKERLQAARIAALLAGKSDPPVADIRKKLPHD